VHAAEAGLEPLTFGCRGECSTTVLLQALKCSINKIRKLLILNLVHTLESRCSSAVGWDKIIKINQKILSLRPSPGKCIKPVSHLVEPL
jgi:hypothetical protein